MKYNTIPIPQFAFTDVPEREAQQIADIYFKSNYNIGYSIETAKQDIRRRIIQDSSDDRIVILSYLINKLTERMVTLPIPRSEMEKSVRQRDTIPTYTALLHFLYRLIEQENIKIPTDLFDEESYKSSQNFILAVHDSLEEIKIERPDKVESVKNVQKEIKKLSGKFLWLGKEDWAKIVIGGIVSSLIKEELLPLLPTIFILIQSFYSKIISE